MIWPLERILAPGERFELPRDCSQWLSKNGVEILETDDSTIRAVFHLNITDEDLQKSIDVFNRI